MGNTSTKTAEEIRKEITRVLEELASYSLIQSISNPKRYVFPCNSPLPAVAVFQEIQGAKGLNLQGILEGTHIVEKYLGIFIDHTCFS